MCDSSSISRNMASEQKNNLVKDIIKTANTIRAKYNILKSSNINQKSQLEDVFKSISKPLNKLVLQGTTTVSKRQKNQFAKRIKLEKMVAKHEDSGDDDDDDDATVKSNRSGLSDDTFYSNDDEDEDDDDVDVTNVTTIAAKKPQKYISNPNEYLQKLLEGVNRKDLDTQFGVRVVSGEFMIGASKLTIIGDVLTLDDSNNKFHMTEGLNELLFMKNPNVKLYNSSDLDKYGDILKYSKVYHRGYNLDNPISGNKSNKYTKIIKPLIKSHYGGGGGSGTSMMQLNDGGIEYVYWNDPSELIARLRLLTASKNAGNNSHNNEIISIIEELREAEIIE